ncbi:hypothetical protein MTCD1_01131 [Colwellia marinimaniae]|uniref:Uncharacterized protein n=1 Tax=Colwellia marinimaniae TaxID=1513592 RepID=A0ABQ0MT42_9GAMM|nr:hypothetical protein MTCD1_01131 [Colwellia marinimaniae]
MDKYFNAVSDTRSPIETKYKIMIVLSTLNTISAGILVEYIGKGLKMSDR